jgi:hypothetical protein
VAHSREHVGVVGLWVREQSVCSKQRQIAGVRICAGVSAAGYGNQGVLLTAHADSGVSCKNYTKQNSKPHKVKQTDSVIELFRYMEGV